jgi:tetratricopeptide (TPR) repeat protein
LTCLAVLVLWPSSGLTETSFDALFQKGNQHYQAGNFEQARDVYNSIVQQGIRSAEVFYNLGNCFIQTGDIGRAIVYYRKAQRIDYSDRDIRMNLNQARQLVNNETRALTPGGFYSSLTDIAGRMGAKGLTLTIACFWVLSAVFFVTGRTGRIRKTRRRAFRATILSLTICVAAAVFLGLLIYNNDVIIHAVAVQEPVTARSGPGDHFSAIYEQLPGYEMIVRRQQNGWAEVELPNGYTAWVPANTIEII